MIPWPWVATMAFGGVVGPQPLGAVVKLDEDLVRRFGNCLLPEFLAEAQRMPPLSRALLLTGAADCDDKLPDADAPSVKTINPKHLIDELGLGTAERLAAEQGLASDDAVLRAQNSLTPEQCAELRQAVDREWRTAPDSVDGAPDIQLNLDVDKLHELIGVAATNMLFELPVTFANTVHKRESRNDSESGACATSTFGDEEKAIFTALEDRNPEIFVRRYTPEERPWNPFHTDASALTVNVALGNDADFQGGKLLACYGGAVQRIDRTEGEALVHASTLLHGVSRMQSGRRYSLVMFFGMKLMVPLELRFSDRDRAHEATTLVALCARPEVIRQCANILPRGPLEVVGPGLSYVASSGLERLGQLIESVVQRYAAPHLRPSAIDARSLDVDDGSWCWSLRAVLIYVQEAAESHGDGP